MFTRPESCDHAEESTLKSEWILPESHHNIRNSSKEWLNLRNIGRSKFNSSEYFEVITAENKMLATEKSKKNSACRGKTAPTVFHLRRRPHAGWENPPNICPTLTQRHRNPVRMIGEGIFIPQPENSGSRTQDLGGATGPPQPLGRRAVR
jgi:hypothetical protein